MDSISRRNLLILLLAVGPRSVSSEGIGGITRLQKLIFLLEREEHLIPGPDGYSFVPYKMGPYSPALYDDLEFLENMGLLESEITAEATDYEAGEMEALSYDFLMSENTDESLAAREDAYEERHYRLTQAGYKIAGELLEKSDVKPVVDKIRRVKSKYCNHSLSDLLYYVYTRYPEMATESEIKNTVLRRGKRHDKY